MLYACAARFDVTKNIKKFLVLRGTKQDLRFMYAQVAGPHIYKNYGVVFNLSLGEFGPSLERILGPPLPPSLWRQGERTIDLSEEANAKECLDGKMAEQMITVMNTNKLKVHFSRK